MKVTVLFGSPRKKGYTSLLLKIFLKLMPECEISVVDCYKQSVKPCIDCRKCRENYRCIFRDMDKINSLVEESDVLIVASPIYNASFPAPLKAILDRFQPYYFARNSLKAKNKKIILLLTCGSKKRDYKEIISPQIKPIIKILGGEFCGEIILRGTDCEKLDIDKFYIKSENEIRSILSKLGDIL